VVRRQYVDPGLPVGGRRRKKGGPGEPPDHALGRSRGGWGTKLHLLCDRRGLPLGFFLTAGQKSECHAFAPLMGRVAAERVLCAPSKVVGDRAYSFWPVLRWLRRRRILPVIPRRRDQHSRRLRRALDRRAYRKRNIIERLVGWLKHRRRLATRFEKFATRFGAMIRMAFLEIYFKVAF